MSLLIAAVGVVLALLAVYSASLAGDGSGEQVAIVVVLLIELVLVLVVVATAAELVSLVHTSRYCHDDARIYDPLNLINIICQVHLLSK